MAIIKSFRDLDVYVLSREQARKIFVVSKSFPKEERFSLTDQIRRSSRAVNDCRSLAAAEISRGVHQED